jgi:hypothetical protein
MQKQNRTCLTPILVAAAKQLHPHKERKTKHTHRILLIYCLAVDSKVFVVLLEVCSTTSVQSKANAEAQKQ